MARYRVIDNKPQNPAAMVDLGVTPGGVPVQAHRAAVENEHSKPGENVPGLDKEKVACKSWYCTAPI